MPKSISLSLIALVLLLGLLPAPAFAQLTGPFPQPDNYLKNQLTGGPKDVIIFIETIANWIFAILLAVSIIYILLAAYAYLSSGGGEGVEKAHKMLLYAAVGIAIAVLARGMVFAVRVLVDRDTPAPQTQLFSPHSHDRLA